MQRISSLFLFAIAIAVAGCAGTMLQAGEKFEDRDLVRLVLLDKEQQVKERCRDAAGTSSSEGCTRAYLRHDGAVAVEVTLRRTLSVEEYQAALPIWCASLAAVQELPTYCGKAPGKPDGTIRSAAMIPVGPLPDGGHLLTLSLTDDASGIEKLGKPARIHAVVPTRDRKAAGWQVIADEWCHSLAAAQWQTIRQDPCHGSKPEEIRITAFVVRDQPLGWQPRRFPCVGWVNQFCSTPYRQ